MNRNLALPAMILLACPIAMIWAGILPFNFRKEIPTNWCGHYQETIEIRKDKEEEKPVEITGAFFTIEPQRIILANGEAMEVKSILETKEKDKSACIISFKNSPLSWLVSESDSPSQFGVIQNDDKDPAQKKLMVLERTVNHWSIEELKKAGITLSHWKDPHQDENLRVEWFRVRFSSSSLQDEDVVMTSWVVSEDKVMCAFRSERSKNSNERVELVWAVQEECFNRSYIEIVIAKNDTQGRPLVSRYTLSVKRILEIVPAQVINSPLHMDENSTDGDSNPQFSR